MMLLWRQQLDQLLNGMMMLVVVNDEVAGLVMENSLF
jgi:hypothetical protein